MLNLNELIGFGVGGDDAHLYWRLYFPTGSGAETTIANEIEMRDVSGGADQCSGGTASASTVLGGNSASNAFDNNPSETRWQSGTGFAAEWIQYHFATPVAVSEFAYTTYAVIIGTAGAGPDAIELQYSDNGVDFATLHSFTPAAWVSSPQTQTFTL